MADDWSNFGWNGVTSGAGGSYYDPNYSEIMQITGQSLNSANAAYAARQAQAAAAAATAAANIAQALAAQNATLDRISASARAAASAAWFGVMGSPQGYAEHESSILDQAVNAVRNYAQNAYNNATRLGDNYRSAVDQAIAALGKSAKDAADLTKIGISSTVLLAGGVLLLVLLLKK